MVVYKPCLLDGFETVMDGQPEALIMTRAMTLSADRPGILMLDYEVGTDKHSLVSFGIWYLLLRGEAEDEEKNSP